MILRWTRHREPPTFEHLAQVLTVDRFDHALFDQIRAQFAE